MFLHGNHAATYIPGTPTAGYSWPPAGPFAALPNYQGYDYLGQNLASHGYVVVSVSADGVNVLGGTDMMPRAELVERQLDLWRDFNATGTVTVESGDRLGAGLAPLGTRFVGHVDLQDVGLMGHSRGGDGVAAAYKLNQRLGSPYGIKAVLSLAPVDFT